MREEDDVLIAEGGVTFPVEKKASTIFVRDFYDLFYTHFRDESIPKETEAGVIFQGSPGIGKVNIALVSHIVRCM